MQGFALALLTVFFLPAALSLQSPAGEASSGQHSSDASTKLTSAYILGPDDVIQVTVWKEPNISGPLTIRPDGKIAVPLIGELAAAGLTPIDLTTIITERLKKFINDPSVVVAVTAVNSKRVYLIGEVQHVGPVPISPGLTVLQAISSAGGLTPFANKKIYILRGDGNKQQKIPFDYKKAVRDGNMQGVTLLTGDTIVVP